MKFKNLFSWLSLVTISVVLGYFVGWSVKNSITNVYAQSEKKTVKLAYSSNPQLKFSDVKVGEQDRKFDESFDAEPEWVKNLSFKLKNTSGKSIVYLKVNVNFPETRSTGNLMSYGVAFGQRPDSKFKQQNKAMLLTAGETLEVSLEREKDKIYKFISERQPIESIQQVELEIGFIIFEDKTAWNAGTFMRQNPNNPDRYEPVKSELRR